MDRSQPAPSRTVIRKLFVDRDYRSIMIVLMMMGLSVGLVMPYLSLWVKNQLHGSTAQQALIFVPRGIFVIFAGMAAAALSDRLARRKGIIISVLIFGACARFGQAAVSHYWAALVLTALSGFSPFALIFALLGDTIRRKKESSGAFITTLERTTFSLGWLFGPVVGGAIISFAGYRTDLSVSGVLLVCSAIWVGFAVHEQVHEAGSEHRPAAPLRLREAVLLAMLFLLGLFIMTGDTGRVLFLPLHLTGFLKEPVAAVSWAFSATVFAELLFMPLAGRMADRFGVTGILSVGMVAQAIYFLGLSMAGAYWQVLALQVLYAFVVSTSLGVAIVFAQSTLGPERFGLTTTTYMVSRGVAPVVNSLLVGLSAPGVGFSRVFLVLGLFAAAALALVAVIALTKRLHHRTG